jgi:hypothetical protein
VWSINQGAWSGALDLSGTSLAPPGAPVATGRQGTNQLDVFVIGSDERVKAIWVTGTNPWQGPVSIRTTANGIPGGDISTAVYGTNQLDVFYVNNSGQTSFDWVVGTGMWQGPSVVIADVALPGAGTSAATQGSQLDLFALGGTNGIVMAQSTSSTGWAAPVTLP